MERLRSYTSTSLWVLPGTILIVSVIAAAASIRVDRALSDGLQLAGWPLFTGSPEAAREIFSTIAGSMLSITGVVFSITMLVLQLASSQFSPRSLRTFLRDAPSKVALGTFVGTFTFALIGLSTVRSTSEVEFVPRLTVSIAFLLVLASLAMFLHYIHHTANKIRVTSIIKSIGEETIAAMERGLPDAVSHDSGRPAGFTETPYEMRSRHAGVIVGVDVPELVDFAKQRDLAIAVTRHVGDFVPLDAVVARSSVELDDKECSDALSHVIVRTERSPEQDIAYGFRELTDIALRALSPAMNDVTTAINVIDAQHDLLLRLGRRGDPKSVHVDDTGAPRLLTKPVSWETYLRMVFGEIGESGREYERIGTHLRHVAEDLLRELPEDKAVAVRLVVAQ